ncbi:MAG: hypothetical protein NTW87_32240 [Planctomycetota bacterium]|nr:hypothetical protein [Planctomycetota bacterium]
MTDAPRKRPWFQFHLSTAIVLMLVASLILWRNVVPRHHAWYVSIVGGHRAVYERWRDAMDQEKLLLTGWPFVISVRAVGETECKTAALAVPLNALASVLILVLAGMCCEWLLRRKARPASGRDDHQPRSESRRGCVP